MARNEKDKSLETQEELNQEVENKPETETDLDNLAKKAGELVNTQKKVNIRVPKDGANPKDHSVTCTINGYTWTIVRGVDVEVPAEVKRILDEAGYLG